MASISNVTLTLASVSDQRQATVSGTMNFDNGDVGRTYRLSIGLWGEDLAGDNLPAADSPADDLLYTFRFVLRSYRSITVSAPGSVGFSETRSIPAAVLNEDSGMMQFDPPLVDLPLSDEVYARATLALPPTTARSATVSAGFGV
jgi:hypothetical protein